MQPLEPDFPAGLRRESSMNQRQRCPCDMPTPKVRPRVWRSLPSQQRCWEHIKSIVVGESAQSWEMSTRKIGFNALFVLFFCPFYFTAPGNSLGCALPASWSTGAIGSRLSPEGPEISIYYILAPIVVARNVDTGIDLGLVVLDFLYISST